MQSHGPLQALYSQSSLSLYDILLDGHHSATWTMEVKIFWSFILLSLTTSKILMGWFSVQCFYSAFWNRNWFFFLLECWSQTLTQSEAVFITPGWSHKMTCTASGLDFDGRWMGCVRQAAGKCLEWMASIRGDSQEKHYSQSVRGRFTISRDNSKDQLYLQMSSVKNEDTAVYYCARQPHWHKSLQSCTKTPPVCQDEHIILNSVHS